MHKCARHPEYSRAADSQRWRLVYHLECGGGVLFETDLADSVDRGSVTFYHVLRRPGWTATPPSPSDMERINKRFVAYERQIDSLLGLVYGP
jgi:hypothetical protein